MAAKTTIEKYGCKFADANELQIELYAIRHGGRWKRHGKEHGEGLLHHYLRARALIWPERYCHRWTELIYKEALENKIVIYVGPASSQKTSHISELGLISYWADPENTAVLVSTMSVEKLDAAILGEIKMLWKMGKTRHPFLAGHPVDHKHCIVTDSIKEQGMRDMRKGIFGKACYIGERYVGLGVYAGIKQKNLWFLADELQYMPATFLDCLPNMLSNTRGGGLHVLGSGNPNHDFESQLAQSAEPPDGWASVENNETSSVWPIKLPGGVCVNLIGTDSPNFDYPPDEPAQYPGLIDQVFERTIIAAYGKYSPKHETQVMGRMKVGLATMRVITRQLCKQHHAHDKAIWEGTKRTRIYAVDPAYGGGDDCIGGWGEFGLDDKGKTIFRIEPPKIIRIDMRLGTQPEDQIAEYVKNDLRTLNIPPLQAFYDSFGKGTVGFAFSKVFGHDCPVPINAGERPTTRPVRADLYVVDDITGEQRLERCDEHYSKFITELWFSVHYAIKAEQIRELPEDVMAEGCWREYYDVAGGKIEVESKPDMKKRTGKSPNKFDWLAILIEGARRHGFVIGGLGDGVVSESPEDDWFDTEQEKYDNIIKSKLLIHA